MSLTVVDSVVIYKQIQGPLFSVGFSPGPPSDKV